jgi:hypothetical protein
MDTVLEYCILFLVGWGDLWRCTGVLFRYHILLVSYSNTVLWVLYIIFGRQGRPVTLHRFILCFFVIRWRSHQHVLGGVFECHILRNTVFWVLYIILRRQGRPVTLYRCVISKPPLIGIVFECSIWRITVYWVLYVVRFFGILYFDILIYGYRYFSTEYISFDGWGDLWRCTGT